MADLDDIRNRLESISDELASAAMDRLKAAMRQGAKKAPVGEKRMTQARRAVEKAISLIDAELRAEEASTDDDHEYGTVDDD